MRAFEELNIAVAGTGYVGLSIATLLSQHHQVTAVDIVPEKVELINNRKSPIQDDYIEKYLAEKELNRVYANLRKAKSKGIGLTIGSDSFCSSLTPYGTTAIGEMYSFVEKAGISEMDTIVAATKVGAEMLKVDTITGTLEVDKFADILVLDGNPLENIRAVAVNNMKIIMKEGTIIKQ